MSTHKNNGMFYVDSGLNKCKLLLEMMMKYTQTTSRCSVQREFSDF